MILRKEFTNLKTVCGFWKNSSRIYKKFMDIEKRSLIWKTVHGFNKKRVHEFENSLRILEK